MNNQDVYKLCMPDLFRGMNPDDDPKAFLYNLVYNFHERLISHEEFTAHLSRVSFMDYEERYGEKINVLAIEEEIYEAAQMKRHLETGFSEDYNLDI